MATITLNISEQALHKYLLNRQSKEYLNKLVNSISDCIISTDSAMQIIMANDAAAKAFGISADRLCGKSLYMLLADEGSRGALRKLKESCHPETGHLELTALENANQPFSVLLSLSRISNKGVDPDYVVVLRDISEDKK